MLKASNVYSKWINILLIIHILSWVLFTPFYQLQMAIFGKRIITFMYLGIIEIAIVAILLVYNKGKIRINQDAKSALSVVCVLLVSLIVNIFFNPKIEAYNCASFLMSWVFPFCIFFVDAQFECKRSEIEKVLKFMLVICTIHAVLIIIQHFTNSILWAYSDYGNGEKVFFTGSDYYISDGYLVRCPGLTNSGLDAGILLLFGITVLTCLKLDRKLKIVLYILFAIAVFYTGTRNIYVVALYMVGVSLIVKFIDDKKYRKRLLVFFTIIISISYFYIIVGMNDFIATKSIFSDNMSVMHRLDAWKNIVLMIDKEPLVLKMFGSLAWQQLGGPLIDNFFIETFYCVGIIALLLIVNFIIRLATICAANSNISAIISSAYIMGFLVYGVLNGMSYLYFTLIMVIYFYWRTNENVC